MTFETLITGGVTALRAALAGAGFAGVLLLSACGGGGGDAAATATDSGATAGNGSGSGTGSGGSNSGGTTCPSAQLADAWIDARLGCLTIGQTVIDTASSATGTKVDRAFVVEQQVLDANWNSALGGNKRRHYAYFLCVQGIPDGISTLNLASDLAVAMSLMSVRPTAVTANTLGIAGGNRPGWVTRACSAATDPVIVDFATRKVVSLNPAALPQLAVYDL